jgi:hypothetical protein
MYRASSSPAAAGLGIYIHIHVDVKIQFLVHVHVITKLYIYIFINIHAMILTVGDQEVFRKTSGSPGIGSMVGLALETVNEEQRSVSICLY